MKAVYNFIFLKKIRLGSLLSLIFFACQHLASCKQTEANTLSVFWLDGKPNGIIIPASLLDGWKDPAGSELQVHLENRNEPVLGSYHFREANNAFLFIALVPLTPGSAYTVSFHNKILGKIQIPLPVDAASSSLLAIYPSADTVPENLLKFYFQFSAPMREGEALQHISLLNEKGDTLPAVFLDLQPELWNKESTELTLWLDPGRIKRDLIPNQKMGNPLQKGKHYSLTVSGKWKDIRGLSIQQSFEKKFFVGERDSNSPQPAEWKLQLPAAETMQPLNIQFGEALDYFLLRETIEVRDEHNKTVTGKINLTDKESVFAFAPDKPWKAGQYHLRIQTKLEDLAGNNLNRPFDRDIKKQPAHAYKEMYERTFVIGN